RVVTPTGLRHGLAVHADDVGGVIKAAARDERRPDAEHVDRYAKLLEAPDLLRVEPSRRDDPHVSEARVVERLPQQKDEPRRDAGVLAARRDALGVRDLLEDGLVDERLARVHAHAP